MMQLTDLPQISSPLPWQAAQWGHISGLIAAGRLPHALLLVGAQYTGKSHLALALSRLLLCAAPVDGLNCGHCHACELSASGGHGDFHWLQPEEKSRVIKIDQVRDVVKFTNQTAGFGARKVVVLAPADSMNVNAFNALLKSLEEPAAGTFLFLVCHRVHNVPATIRSRCQLLRLPAPSEELSLDWLEQLTGSREDSSSLLEVADGRPLLAEQLYLQGGSEALQARRLGLHALFAGKITAPQVRSAFDDAEVDEFLEQVTEEIQRRLCSLSREQLASRQGRGAFSLLDELGQLRRAVSAGANPGKQLLLDAVLAKIQRELGGGCLGDKIQ
jgi:DNA polymerase-3 subunit delta'